MKRSDLPFPQKPDELLLPLKKIWEEGWLDDFSNEHPLIKAIENRLTDFVASKQLKSNNISFPSFGSEDISMFSLNYCCNLSNRIQFLLKTFGEPNIRRFFTDQVSAGKNNYDEFQFFRALSEISILSFLCTISQTGLYEPKINGRKNPEARLFLPNNVIVDVEVKTPGFSTVQQQKDIAIPTILLDSDGRALFEEFCNTHGIQCYMPRVNKLKDFLNSAASKFEDVDHIKHINMLYINWTLSEFMESSFQEAFSIISNPYNGILANKEIGLQVGISEEAYRKITAVVVYTESWDGLMFNDFRHVWQRDSMGNPHFAVYALHNKSELFSKIKMNPSKETTQCLLYCYKQQNTDYSNDLLSIISEHYLKK